MAPGKTSEANLPVTLQRDGGGKGLFDVVVKKHGNTLILCSWMRWKSQERRCSAVEAENMVSSHLLRSLVVNHRIMESPGLEGT